MSVPKQELNPSKSGSSGPDSDDLFTLVLRLVFLFAIAVIGLKYLNRQRPKIKSKYHSQSRMSEAIMKDKSPENTEEVKIEISNDDLDGQFEEIAKKFNLSYSAAKEVEKSVRETVNQETEGLDVDEETKSAIANVMASTIRQEIKGLESDVL